MQQRWKPRRASICHSLSDSRVHRTFSKFVFSFFLSFFMGILFRFLGRHLNVLAGNVDLWSHQASEPSYNSIDASDSSINCTISSQTLISWHLAGRTYHSIRQFLSQLEPKQRQSETKKHTSSGSLTYDYTHAVITWATQDGVATVTVSPSALPNCGLGRSKIAGS